MNKEALIKLSAEELTEIITASKDNFAIVKLILNDSDLINKLTISQLFNIGKVYYKAALYLLRDESLRNKLDSYQITLLGLNHCLVAEHILKEPSIRSNLDFSQLMELAKRHSTAAICFLCSIESDKHFAKHCRIILQNHPQLATLLLKNPSLAEKLSISDFVAAAVRNKSSAVHLLSSEKLIKQLKGYQLTEMGRNHPSLIESILKNKMLSRKLSDLEKTALNQALEFRKKKLALKSGTIDEVLAFQHIANMDVKGVTDLHLAAHNKHWQVMDFLLQTQGLELLEKPDDNGRTPLLLAAYNDNLAVMKLLIENGADISRKDSNGLDIYATLSKFGAKESAAQIKKYLQQTPVRSKHRAMNEIYSSTVRSYQRSLVNRDKNLSNQWEQTKGLKSTAQESNLLSELWRKGLSYLKVTNSGTNRKGEEVCLLADSTKKTKLD